MRQPQVAQASRQGYIIESRQDSGRGASGKVEKARGESEKDVKV